MHLRERPESMSHVSTESERTTVGGSQGLWIDAGTDDVVLSMVVKGLFGRREQSA